MSGAPSTDFANAPRTVTLRAHAKLNLALAVDRPIASGAHIGYHPIASWMTPIDLADELEVERLEPDRLSRYAIHWHPRAPQQAQAINWSVRDDLAVRAHQLLEEVAGRTLPVQMKLGKSIPPGSGLGGGSADAAAMLYATREVYGLDVGDEQLRELGAQLGADVPFFLQGSAPAGARAAIVEGLGEQITPCARVDGHFVLILPRFGCSTRRVYHIFNEQFDDEDHIGGQCEARSFRDGAVRAMAGAQCVDSSDLFNDLAVPAQRAVPALAVLARRIEEAVGEAVHMSGSGSALFVVVGGRLGPDAPTKTRFDAEMAAHRVQRVVGEDAAIVVVRTV